MVRAKHRGGTRMRHSKSAAGSLTEHVDKWAQKIDSMVTELDEGDSIKKPKTRAESFIAAPRRRGNRTCSTANPGASRNREKLIDCVPMQQSTKIAPDSRQRLRRALTEVQSSPIFAAFAAKSESSDGKPVRAGEGTRDVASYREELFVLKKKYAVAIKERRSFHTAMLRLEAESQRQARYVDSILKHVVDTQSDSGKTDLLKALRGEKARNDSLRAKLRSLDDEVTKLRRRKDELTNGLKFSRMRELQVQNRTFFNEARRLRKLAQTIAEEEQNIEMEIVARVSEHTDMIEEKFASDRGVLLERSEELERELDEERNRLQEMMLKVNDISSRPADAEDPSAAAAPNNFLESKIRRQTQEIEAKDLQVEALNDSVAALQSNLDDLTRQLADERLANQTLSESSSETETRVRNLEQLVEAKKGEVTEMEEEMERLRSVSEAHQKTVTERMKEIESLKAELQSSVGRQTELNLTRTTLESDKTHLIEEKTQLLQELGESKERVKELEVDNTTLRLQLKLKAQDKAKKEADEKEKAEKTSEAEGTA